MTQAVTKNRKTANPASNIEILVADSRKALCKYADASFQTCVTSPPYWSLRDYSIDGQIGAEESLEEYISDLVEIFREVRRTLNDDGTLWLNIGDAYTSGNRTWRDDDKKNAGRAMSFRPPTPPGLKPKDLIGIPWLLAFAMQRDGWYLRSDIVWHKPNCQPESVKDRPTRCHEYIFLFSKSLKYLYDHEAVQESRTDKNGVRNRRTVWSINTNGFKGSHFAVFPTELVELCIRAGSTEGSIVLDPFLGTGTVAEVCVQLGRGCVGIELNPEYAEMAEKRIDNVNKLLFT